jgi:hypothetical protein
MIDEKYAWHAVPPDPEEQGLVNLALCRRTSMTNHDHDRAWRDAGYPNQMGSTKFPPPPDPEFVRAYHLTSSEHGMSSISLCRQKVARFSDANDPFELLAFNTHEREIRRLLRRFKNTQNTTN